MTLQVVRGDTELVPAEQHEGAVGAVPVGGKDVVRFIADLTSRLDSVVEKVDGLEKSNTALRSEVRRLKPVLEVLDDVSAEETSRQRLNVQLHLTAAGADPTRPFEAHEGNPPLPFSQTLDAFLGSSEQQVLLVSGAAGSAKAASSQEACRHVRGEYSAQRAKEGVRVVAIYAHLPSLRNPLTGLFREALQAAPYCMRDSQIDDLHQTIRTDPRVEVRSLPA